MTEQLKNSKTVLVFNERRLLVAVFASVYQCAKLTHIDSGSITRTCNGKYMSCGKLYFRYLIDGIELEQTDLNTLRLEDYDKLCGIERKVYTNVQMNRINWKYNKQKHHETTVTP